MKLKLVRARVVHPDSILYGVEHVLDVTKKSDEDYYLKENVFISDIVEVDFPPVGQNNDAEISMIESSIKRIRIEAGAKVEKLLSRKGELLSITHNKE